MGNRIKMICGVAGRQYFVCIKIDWIILNKYKCIDKVEVLINKG
jgi:hypothetical protein